MRTPLLIASGLILLLTAGLGVAWQRGLLDTSPPAIEASLPTSEAPLRGTVPLRLSVSDAPGVTSLTVQIDERAPQAISPDTAEIPLETATLPDGPHRLRIAATDGSVWENAASVTVSFETDNTHPALDVAEGSLSGVQGKTLALYLRPSEPLASVTGDFLGKPRTFYPVAGGLWRALVGVPIEAEAGHPPLRLELSDHAGNRTFAELPVEIAAGSFPAGGTIRLTATQEAARLDDRSRAKTRKERADVYRQRLPSARWSGPLAQPVSGRRTSAFGRYRTYSDGRRSYHYGTDLAAPAGTPVAAAAAGVVRHAGWQHIFGNVVIVDHGQGVSTSYNHLSATSVAVGDAVEAGQEIGRVGSTGQSTGPHLHWGLVVDGVSVDAEQWLDRSFAPEEFAAFKDATQINGGAVWADDTQRD